MVLAWRGFTARRMFRNGPSSDAFFHIASSSLPSIFGLPAARGISAFNGSIDPRTTLLYSFPAFSQIGAMSKPISSLLTTFLRARSMAGGISGATLRLFRYWHLWL